MAHIEHATLTGAAVMTITLDEPYETLTVLCRATASPAEIYFRSDGTVPTVGGNDCHVVSFQIPMVVVQSASDDENPLVVQLISSGAIPFTVMGT